MGSVFRTFLPALAGAALWALPVVAADWGYDLADDLMSPYCPGRALSECPSPNAEQLRVWILAQDDAGRTRTDVEAELFLQFGDRLLQAPRAEGIGLFAYAIPAAVFALGGVFVVGILRRGARSKAMAPVSQHHAPEDQELERLLDEQVQG